MNERSIDVVAVVPDRREVSRWHAVSSRGPVAAVATLAPIVPFGLAMPGALELSLYVAPEWRRRGIGSRLLVAVCEDTAVPRLVADVPADSPGEAFCRRHGFRHTQSRRHDLLTYCDVHGAWLGELVETEHPGYRLTHWTGDLPTVSGIDELLRSPSRPGNAVLTAVDADGDVAAYALAIVGALSRHRARQYGPAVLPEHRGRRLGRWVNAALIQRLRDVHPHVSEVETAAAVNDSHLLAAHEHLGFQPLRRTHLYELAVS